MKTDSPNGSPTTFMTGATGLLGHYVLRDLLMRGRRIVAMLRFPLADSIQRLRQLVEQLDFSLDPYIEKDQLVFVEGALPDELPDIDWGPTNDILSCAASLQLFGNGNEEPHKTNVRGVEKLIAWAERRDIKRIHAVSTAYVCGYHTENVGEVFHHPQPKFQTEYEHSKWLAESLFAQWREKNGNVLTVTRPSFLVGDSRTGYTSQFGGFYQLARMVALLRERYAEGKNGESIYIPLRIPGRPHEPQNFVPVDFASRLIAEIVLDEQLHGRIYHLTDPTPPTNDHIKQCLEDYFNIHGGYFVDSDKVDGDCSPAETLLWKAYDVITPRVTLNPVFHQDNTRQAMEAIGLDFPPLDRKRFFSLLDYAVSNHWGAGDGRSES